MPYWEHFLLEGVKFAAFAFICGCLTRFRFGRKATGLAAAGALPPPMTGTQRAAARRR